MVERCAAVLAVAWMLLGPSPVLADVLELADGTRVEGTLREATPAGVTIEVGGQSVRFEPGKVRAIYFGVPPPARPAPGSPPPAAAASLPSPSSVPAGGALQIVRRLRATVAAGTTLREYERQVNEAAPVVELYLSGLPADASAAAIRDAMRCYVLAKWAWSNQGRASHTVWLRKDEALRRCAAYEAFAREMQARGEAFYSERVRNYVVIGDGVIPVLWSCAADRTDEAEHVSAAAETK